LLSTTQEETHETMDATKSPNMMSLVSDDEK